jgi:hypothetical protein
MFRRPTANSSKSNLMSARNLEGYIEAANQARTRTQKTDPDRFQMNSSWQTVRGLNLTGADLDMHQPVWLTDPAILPADNMLAPNSNTTPIELSDTAGDGPIVGVTLEPIWSNRIGTVLIQGDLICKVWMPYALEECRRAGFNPAGPEPLLEFQPEGPAIVMWSAHAAAETIDWAWIRLGMPSNVMLRGYASGNIAPDTSGSVLPVFSSAAANSPITAHLDWMHGDLQVSNGKEVLCCWFPWEQKWRIIGAECEDIPPSYGSVTVPNGTHQDLTNGAWTAPTGMVQSNISGGVATGDPNSTGSTNGIGVTLPGDYRVDVQMTVAVDSDNTSMSVRLARSPTDTGEGIPLFGRTANDIVSAAFNERVTVTQADLDSAPTPGVRYFTTEVRGDGANMGVTYRSFRSSIEQV